MTRSRRSSVARAAHPQTYAVALPGHYAARAGRTCPCRALGASCRCRGADNWRAARLSRRCCLGKTSWQRQQAALAFDHRPTHFVDAEGPPRALRPRPQAGAVASAGAPPTSLLTAPAGRTISNKPPRLGISPLPARMVVDVQPRDADDLPGRSPGRVSAAGGDGLRGAGGRDFIDAIKNTRDQGQTLL